MLIKLIPDEEKLKKVYENCKITSNETKDKDFLEYLESHKTFESHFEMLNVNEGYENTPNGVYCTSLNPFFMIVQNNENIIEPLFSYRANYGICDSWKDVIENFPELNDPEKKYFVTMTPFYKEGDSINWDKFGHYYGDFKKDNEIAFTFTIYEMIE